MVIEIQVLNQKSGGEAPAGKYKARYLNEKGFGALQTLNPCKSVQIIEGIHSGQIIPYDSYVVIGDLPAQADVLLQNVRMIEHLAEAGRKITDQARKIGLLQEENERLRNGEYAVNYAPQIGELKERNQQLEWEIEAWRNCKKVQLPRKVAAELDELIIKGISNAAIANRFFAADEKNKERYGVSKLIDWAERGQTDQGKIRVMIFLSALVNGYTEAPGPEKDEAAELLSGVTDIVKKWWLEAPNGRNANSHSDRLAEDICDYIKQREDDKPPF